MSNTNDEPAFPHLGLYQGADGNLHPTPTQHGGMTLRDYFAGQVLAGRMARGSDYRSWDDAAADAYEAADAMIAARAKR